MSSHAAPIARRPSRARIKRRRLAALATVAAAAHVVITTVGPYAKYGHALAHACAAAGTDYVDLTGEVLFARASADENDELARSTGARIVHSCGFDSIPSDIGVHVLHARWSSRSRPMPPSGVPVKARGVESRAEEIPCTPS